MEAFKTFWLALGPFVSGVIAACIAHYFSARRDASTHKRQLDYEEVVAKRTVRRSKLLNAYEVLDRSEDGRMQFLELDAEEYFKRTQERALAFSSLKLFGDEELCCLVDELIEFYRSERSDWSNDNLMNKLRDKVRLEYGLEVTSSRYKWVDYKRPKESVADLRIAFDMEALKRIVADVQDGEAKMNAALRQVAGLEPVGPLPLTMPPGSSETPVASR